MLSYEKSGPLSSTKTGSGTVLDYNNQQGPGLLFGERGSPETHLVG